MSDGLKGTILENSTMKPMMVLAPGVMSPEHQQLLRDNGICVVESEKPELVRFMDPISATADRPRVEQAAIEFSRILLNQRWSKYSNLSNIGIGEFGRIFVDCLIAGTPLAWESKARREQEIFDDAKYEELCRLGREEAKAERLAAKAAKDAAAKAKTPAK